MNYWNQFDSEELSNMVGSDLVDDEEEFFKDEDEEEREEGFSLASLGMSERDFM